MKSIKISVVAFLVLFAMPNFMNAQTSNALPVLESMETIEMKVKGVGCADDIKSIIANVEKLEGVSRCMTIKKGATTRFEVKLLPSMTNVDAITAAIEDTPGCKNPNDRPYKVKQ